MPGDWIHVISIGGTDVSEKIANSSVTSMDRANSIECESTTFGFTVERDVQTGTGAGRRLQEPYRFVFRAYKTGGAASEDDKAAAGTQWFKAVTQGLPVTFELRRYRNQAAGSGEAIYETHKVERGYVVGYRLIQRGETGSEGSNIPRIEVAIAADKVTMTANQDGNFEVEYDRATA